MIRRAPLALTLAALLLTAACSGEPPVADADGVVEGATVATLLRDDEQLATTAGLVADTGLAPALDAAPAYTLLAPINAAYDALDLNPAAAGPQDRAVVAATLRAHLLPGYVTLADIESALAAGDGAPVTMQTMAQTPVTFTREDDSIVATAADGARATVKGPGLSGGNGVVLPVDAVLKAL